MNWSCFGSVKTHASGIGGWELCVEIRTGIFLCLVVVWIQTLICCLFTITNLSRCVLLFVEQLSARGVKMRRAHGWGPGASTLSGAGGSAQPGPWRLFGRSKTQPLTKKPPQTPWVCIYMCIYTHIQHLNCALLMRARNVKEQNRFSFLKLNWLSVFYGNLLFHVSGYQRDFSTYKEWRKKRI